MDIEYFSEILTILEQATLCGTARRGHETRTDARPIFI
jgi:hypothetical protein